jgi:hypothetical protein
LSAREKSLLKYWRNMPVGVTAAAIGIQAAFFMAFGDEDKGDKMWLWENEKGHEWDIDITPIMRMMPWNDESDSDSQQRFYTHFGKQMREVGSWVMDPTTTIERKTSPRVQVVREQIFGAAGQGFDAPWVRDDKDFWASLSGRRGRAIGILEKVVPFSVRGTNFALTAPMAKGMTPWKLKTAFTKELRAYADPGLLRHHFDAEPEWEANLVSLVLDTYEAGERNGHNSQKIFVQSLGVVRGELYREFLQALEKGHVSKMERMAEKITRLHKGVGGAIQSARSRDMELSSDDIFKMQAAFYAAAQRASK